MGILRKKKRERKPSFKSVLTSILATQAAIFLLLLAGVSLAGTAAAFIATMPLFVVFSPILVPAGITTGLLTTGLAASGGAGATAVTIILWLYKRATGKEAPPALSKILKKIIPGGAAAPAGKPAAAPAAKPEPKPAAKPAAKPAPAPTAKPAAPPKWWA